MIKRRSPSPKSDVEQSSGSATSDAQLLQAAKSGDLQAAKTARAAGGGLGARDSVPNDGVTPLHWAAAGGHVDVARYLLKAKTPVDQPSHSGSSALKLAAWHGHAEVAALLCDAGANILKPSRNGTTPLAFAAQFGSRRVLELFFDRLPDNGAATFAHEGARMLPLHFAAQGCADPDVVDYIWSVFPDALTAVDLRGAVPLLHAARFNANFDVVRMLVKRSGAEESENFHRTRLDFSSPDDLQIIARLPRWII
eukprot:COSAG02_NODE_3829_length_6176_cov_26.434096_2_plen_253_part_00